MGKPLLVGYGMFSGIFSVKISGMLTDKGPGKDKILWKPVCLEYGFTS